SVLNHRKTLAQIGEYGGRGHALDRMAIERGQAREDRPGVGGYRKRGRVQTCKWRNMFDPPGIQNDVSRYFNRRLSPSESGSGRPLQHRDKVTLVLLRDEARGRTPELKARESD